MMLKIKLCGAAQFQLLADIDACCRATETHRGPCTHFDEDERIGILHHEIQLAQPVAHIGGNETKPPGFEMRARQRFGGTAQEGPSGWRHPGRR